MTPTVSPRPTAHSVANAAEACRVEALVLSDGTELDPQANAAFRHHDGYWVRIDAAVRVRSAAIYVEVAPESVTEFGYAHWRCSSWADLNEWLETNTTYVPADAGRETYV
jgi:hypothetical protein